MIITNPNAKTISLPENLMNVVINKTVMALFDAIATVLVHSDVDHEQRLNKLMSDNNVLLIVDSLATENDACISKIFL